MTNQDFQALKEKDIAAINRVVQTVTKSNKFRKGTRIDFERYGVYAIDCMFAQRENVYKVLFGFDFEEKYDKDGPRFSGKIIDRATQLNIMQVITEVITSAKTIRTGDSIVDTATNNKYHVKEDYQASNTLLVEALEKLMKSIQREGQEEEKKEEVKPEPVVEPEKKLTHKLTEEDFDDNPDLNLAGLNVGDEIDIDAPIDFSQVPQDTTQEPEKKEGSEAPPQGGAVMTQEEIGEGNKKEKKTPRKRSSKKS